jgi:MFS transporter, DHA1 family, multidrug resistance protein
MAVTALCPQGLWRRTESGLSACFTFFSGSDRKTDLTTSTTAIRGWPGPQWTLAALLAALATVGPFSIDTYMPAFAGIAKSLDATPLQMQQTLSAYLFGFAFMNLFHGALADAFGRRTVILVGSAVFALSSAGCALAPHIGVLVAFRALQGLAAGAGVVVSRAVIRDMFPPEQAQRVMSQVTIYFGIAPAVAPLLGGWLFVHLGWESVFWFLAVVGALLWFLPWRYLPESLPVSQRQPFHARPLMRGYWSMFSSPRFVLLVVASGVPFNGMFLYVLSAPVFLGEILGLQPTQFAWFFIINVAGIMGGAWLSGRLAGRVPQSRQVRWGFTVMAGSSVLNLLANLIWTPHVAWSMWPIAFYSLGWAMVVPAVTLMVLDLFPARRGMASSLQSFLASATNGVVAGALAPLVMHDAHALAWASMGLMAVGVVAWWAVDQLPR